MFALALILMALARQLKPCPDCLGGCANCQHLGLVPKEPSCQ